MLEISAFFSCFLAKLPCFDFERGKYILRAEICNHIGRTSACTRVLPFPSSPHIYPPMPKIRADELLARLGLAPSRSAASNLIREGKVFLPEGSPVRKPGLQLDESCVPSISEPQLHVSRGAGKLLAALEAFPVDIEEKTALDLGASTGGFTQVLLEHGASKVYAVDVGTDQLHPMLKNDPRVVSLEQTNARDLTRALIPEPIDILTGDLSFISLTKVLPACAPLLAARFHAIVLIKPQFEAGRDQVGSGGVVRSREIQALCVKKIEDFAREVLGWKHILTISSPLLGPNGNQEYLAHFTHSTESKD